MTSSNGNIYHNLTSLHIVCVYENCHLTLAVAFIFRNIAICLYSRIPILRWHRLFKSFLVEDRNPSFFLRSKYHGCWCLGEVRSQGFRGHSIDKVTGLYCVSALESLIKRIQHSTSVKQVYYLSMLGLKSNTPFKESMVTHLCVSEISECWSRQKLDAC